MPQLLVSQHLKIRGGSPVIAEKRCTDHLAHIVLTPRTPVRTQECSRCPLYPPAWAYYLGTVLMLDEGGTNRRRRGEQHRSDHVHRTLQSMASSDYRHCTTTGLP